MINISDFFQGNELVSLVQKKSASKGSHETFFLKHVCVKVKAMLFWNIVKMKI